MGHRDLRRGSWWFVIVVSVLVSTGKAQAANVGVNQPAEDTAHTSGDEGIQVLAVRKDTGAVLSDTDGDYTPLQTDGSGNLRVNVASGTIIANAGTGTLLVDSELPTAAALADAAANPTTATAGVANLLFNGTTWDRMRGDTTNGLDVDVTRVSGSVTVDSELPAAAALADAASATPTTATVGAVHLLMNATTMDRQRAVVNALDSVGTGIAAAGLIGQLDDTAPSAVTENQFAPVRLSTRRALLVEGVASGTNLNVNVNAALPTGANVIGALSANQTVNLAQVGGTNTVTGGVAGTQGVGGLAANDGVAAGNPNLIGGFAEADAAALQAVSAEGDAASIKTDLQGRMLVRTDHPNRVNCTLLTTATTSTLVTGCGAPGAGLSIYITDIEIGGGVAASTTAPAIIQTGTGGTCGTGTAVIYRCSHPATGQCENHMGTPIKVAANSEVCILDGVTGTKNVTIQGYIAP